MQEHLQGTAPGLVGQKVRQRPQGCQDQPCAQQSEDRNDGQENQQANAFVNRCSTFMRNTVGAAPAIATALAASRRAGTMASTAASANRGGGERRFQLSRERIHLINPVVACLGGDACLQHEVTLDPEPYRGTCVNGVLGAVVSSPQGHG